MLDTKTKKKLQFVNYVKNMSFRHFTFLIIKKIKKMFFYKLLTFAFDKKYLIQYNNVLKYKLN